MDLQSLTVIVVAVLPVIMGVVEFTKKVGLEGKALTLASFGVGAVLSLAGWLYVTFPDLQMYIAAVFVTLIGGMAACGTYDLIDKRFPKQK